MTEKTDTPAENTLHWPPDKLLQFARGMITMAELEGMSDEKMQGMADVGYTLLSQGRLRDARKIFEGLAVLNPYEAYYQLALGSIAQRNHEFDQALSHYTRAIQMNQLLPEPFANRAEVRLAMDDVEGAIQDLVQTVKLSKNSPNDSAALRAKATLKAIHDRVQALSKSA